MDKFMERAVDLAVKNVREGGDPFGAVLVKDGEIVAEGVNELHKKFDISGHAELLAIRKVQAEIGTHDLTGYIMYASGEPCPMCLTSMYMSGIREGYYCASIDDAEKIGMGLSKVIYEDLTKDRKDRQLLMTQMPLQDGQEDPMKLWFNK